ncbi:MAG: hypothetical protein ACFNL4_09595, partial [Corynebacterium matruchotii]
KIIVVACGTAAYAGHVAKYAIEHWCRVPVEAWKSNFYLIRYRERCESTVRWCPPTEPFDQLFQTVWGRWLAGDRPSFDPLTTKKYRR